MTKKKNKKNFQLGDHIHDQVNLNTINWFPGHMNKAIKKIKTSLKMVDIILEVRDARSPLVTGNKLVHQEIGEKCKLIVINKNNLADPLITSLWNKWFLSQKEPFVFINSLNKTSVKSILNLAKKAVHQNRLKSNPEATEKKMCKMMVLGLPNTGKSTIINMLANRQATKVADKPGQTRQQLWVKVDQDILMLDTPGVMPPKIVKHEHGVWLSVLNAIPASVVSPEVPACFLIEHLLKLKSPDFKKRYNLENFNLSLLETLNQISKERGCLQARGEFDYDRAYKLILTDFRSGLLGKVSFGKPPIL